MSKAFVIPESLAGKRLDAAIRALRPELSLSGVRGLWTLGKVRLDGRPAAKGDLVRAGARLELPDDALDDSSPPAPKPEIRILFENAEYVAFDKPAGLSTAAVPGRPDADAVNLEILVLTARPGCLLLTRLDKPTAGLVLAAKTPAAQARFRELERAGGVDKRYWAILAGDLDAEVTVKRVLDTAKRRKTRVLADETDSPLGWTVFIPQRRLGPGRTLCEVRILKGAKHQIRAHAAALGLPIEGDPLYGPDPAATGLKLHHARIVFLGFHATTEPDWINEA